MDCFVLSLAEAKGVYLIPPAIEGKRRAKNNLSVEWTRRTPAEEDDAEDDDAEGDAENGRHPHCCLSC